MAETNVSYDIRLMTEDDFPRCQELREQVGWNQTLNDWRRFLSFNPPGCFTAVSDGQVIGTACTIPYENRFGWVAMVIVDLEFRRLGIGKALLLKGIQHLEDRGLTVKLDATPDGKLLYDTLGFKDEYGAARYEADAFSWAGTDPSCHPVSAADMDELSEFDARLFGASRRAVLEAYVKFYSQHAFCVRKDGALAGYIFAREGSKAFHVGPWVANDPDTAQKLLSHLIAVRQPQRLFLDILEPNPHVQPMLTELGFKKQRPFIRMFKGVNTHPGTPEIIYSISGPELG